MGLALIVIRGTRTNPTRTGPGAGAYVGGDLHSLVVDPNNASRIYVGGHQAVALSADGARSWRRINSLDNADAMGWAFLDTKTLVGGHPGLNLSSDGISFKRTNDGLPSTDVHSLGAGGGVIYAGLPQAGIIASTDGAKSWEVRSSLAGRRFMGRILVDPQTPQHLLAADMMGGVSESRDGGRHWSDIGGVQQPMWVSWDPHDPTHIIASGMAGGAESTDDGQSWRDLRLPQGASIVEMSPQNPRVLYAAIFDGSFARVLRSIDGGDSWS